MFLNGFIRIKWYNFLLNCPIQLHNCERRLDHSKAIHMLYKLFYLSIFIQYNSVKTTNDIQEHLFLDIENYCRRDGVLFMLFVFVWALWCSTNIVLCFCSVFLPLVYYVLPVSLECPFWIAPSLLYKFISDLNHL